MQYKNTKTGATFSSPFVIKGGDWVPCDGKLEKTLEDEPEQNTQELPKDAEPPKEPVDLTGDDAYDGITKKQIMQELDAFGVKYDPKVKKQVLYDLMMAQGE